MQRHLAEHYPTKRTIIENGKTSFFFAENGHMIMDIYDTGRIFQG